MNTALTLGNTSKNLNSSEPGENTRRLSLITGNHIHDVDVFALFGWNDLPQSLKNAIRSDMEAYRDELLGLYSTCDGGVKSRRKSVSYWIRAYRDGICSEQTAAAALSATISV